MGGDVEENDKRRQIGEGNKEIDEQSGYIVNCFGWFGDGL
jgi:hypothetical protein